MTFNVPLQYTKTKKIDNKIQFNFLKKILILVQKFIVTISFLNFTYLLHVCVHVLLYVCVQKACP